MKRHWKVSLLLFLTILNWGLTFRINPGLLDFSRWPKKWSDFTHPPAPNTHDAPIILSHNGFKDRIDQSWWGKTDVDFYRRSASRNGIDTVNRVPLNLSPSWSFPNLNIEMHTASKATPAVDESGVYVGGDSGWFYAFDHDGHLRWRFHIASAMRGIHSTAILNRQRVCFGGYNATFYCLDKRDGKPVWTMDSTMSGFGASPMALREDLLTVIETSDKPDAYAVRFNLKEGDLNWQSPFVGEQVHSSPSYSLLTNSIYFGSNNKRLHRVDVDNGHLLWSVDLDGEIKGTPLVYGNQIFVSTWGGKLHALDAQSGQIHWSAELSGSSQSSPTFIPGTGVLVLGERGAVTGVDQKTGKIRWRFKSDMSVMSSALAVRTPGSDRYVAWMACSSKELCALDAANGKVLSRIALPGPLTGVPVAYGDSLYVALNFPGGLLKLSPNTAR